MFVLVRKLEEMSLQTCEVNGRNDVRSNAGESGFVWRKPDGNSSQHNQGQR